MIQDPQHRLDAPIDDDARTLVVGGGFAGLACAREIARAGRHVVVFDKGRGPGGRASTRRVDLDEATSELAIDHGAQFFTARGEGFRRAVGAWESAGAAARWTPRLATVGADGAPIGRRDAPSDTPSDELWVGTPTMSALVRQLATAPVGTGRVEVRYGVRVVGLSHGEHGHARRSAWIVTVATRDADGRETTSTLGPVDQLVLAAPTPQTVELLETVDPAVRERLDATIERLRAVRFDPCWAVLAVPGTSSTVPGTSSTALDPPFQAASVEGGPLGWVADNASKPGRPANPAWTFHATPEWSRDALEDDADDVARTLLEAVGRLVGRALDPSSMAYLRAHRWRYARVVEPQADAGEPFVWRPDLALGVCGDGCAGPRIEAAWTSGHALGRRIAREITIGASIR